MPRWALTIRGGVAGRFACYFFLFCLFVSCTEPESRWMKKHVWLPATRREVHLSADAHSHRHLGATGSNESFRVAFSPNPARFALRFSEPSALLVFATARDDADLCSRKSRPARRVLVSCDLALRQRATRA